MIQEVWRLLTGKISRPNDKGVMEIHKAPYDFVPTEGELRANRFRMIPADSDLKAVRVKNASSVTLKQNTPASHGSVQQFDTPPVTWTETVKTSPMEQTEINSGPITLSSETRTAEEIKKDIAEREAKRHQKFSSETSIIKTVMGKI